MTVRSIHRALLALVLAACSPDVAASPDQTAAQPTASPAPTVPATTMPTETPASSLPASSPPAFSCSDPVSDGTLVAYRDADDLWLYDSDADASHRLTNDGDQRIEFAPAFLGVGCLAYATSEPPSFQVIDLSAGESSRLPIDERFLIGDFAVSPDATTLVGLRISYDTDSTFRLVRASIAGGEPEVIHQFPASLGRGGSSEDEVSVAWSPDGSRILVANTHEYSDRYPEGSLYLFDTNGDVLHRWAGTHPRWSPDGRNVYFRGHGGFGVGADVGWKSIDVETLQVTELALRAGTNFAAVSPTGRYIAYDTSSFGDLPLGAKVTGEPPDVFIYDLETDRETRTLRGGIAALWVSATEIVATNVSQGPPNPDTWGGAWWDPLGTVMKVSVDGAVSSVSMTATLFDTAVSIAR